MGVDYRDSDDATVMATEVNLDPEKMTPREARVTVEFEPGDGPREVVVQAQIDKGHAQATRVWTPEEDGNDPLGTDAGLQDVGTIMAAMQAALDGLHEHDKVVSVEIPDFEFITQDR